MFYNAKQTYPAARTLRTIRAALVVDAETVEAGPTAEVIEIALGDAEGRILFESLVRPAFNRLPPSMHHRFERGEFASATDWVGWGLAEGLAAARRAAARRLQRRLRLAGAGDHLLALPVRREDRL
jgi:hypothetical protein